MQRPRVGLRVFVLRVVNLCSAARSRNPPRSQVNVSARKLSVLKLNSDYLRVATDVSSLKKSLESVGLIHPVTINQDDELLAGARRFQAVRELGWDEIPVHVVDRDVLVQELISIDENLVRASLTTLELERSLNRGREIYESINPAASKVDLSAEELSGEERLLQKETRKKSLLLLKRKNNFRTRCKRKIVSTWAKSFQNIVLRVRYL